MILLNNYQTFSSSEIVAIQKSDHLLVLKVATIAYKLLVENILIFLKNQTKKIKIFFQKENLKPLPTPKPVNYASSFANKVPGTVEGMLLIRGVRSLIGWNTLGFNEKDLECAQFASSQIIYRIKQLEHDYFPLAFAAIPILINFVDAFQKEPKNLPLTKKVVNTAKKQFSAPYFIFCTTAIGLSIASSYGAQSLGLVSREGFNPSTQLMQRALITPIADIALSQTAREHPTFSSIYSSIYFISEGIFLSNVVQRCHTPFESVVGCLWATAVIRPLAGAITRPIVRQLSIWQNRNQVA